MDIAYLDRCLQNGFGDRLLVQTTPLFTLYMAAWAFLMVASSS